MKATQLLFWKLQGGEAVCKYRGRWHYIGHTATELADLERWAGSQGYKLLRVGIPRTVASLWWKYGNKADTLRDHLPRVPMYPDQAHLDHQRDPGL